MDVAAERKNNARASLAVIATISATWNSRLRHRRKSRCRWGCAMADAVEVTAAELLLLLLMMVLNCRSRAAFEVATAAEFPPWPMSQWMVMLPLHANKHN
jgi:hypothetical protein